MRSRGAERSVAPRGRRCIRLTSLSHHKLGKDRVPHMPHDDQVLASPVVRPPKVYRLAVVGTGYVGTVVAACFAHLGYEVTGIETDTAKLARLQIGQIPFHEPGLEDLVTSCLRARRLRFTADYADGLTGADAVFLCVGTPPLPDGRADMSALNDAARSVAAAVRHPVTVVTKSTIPLGAARSVWTVLQDTLVQRNGQAAPVTLVHNPEFLREGSAIGDFLHPDRVVLGSEDAQAVRLVADLYRPILQQCFNGADPTKRPGLLCTIHHRRGGRLLEQRFPRYKDQLYQRAGQYLRPCGP